MISDRLNIWWLKISDADSRFLHPNKSLFCGYYMNMPFLVFTSFLIFLNTSQNCFLSYTFHTLWKRLGPRQARLHYFSYMILKHLSRLPLSSPVREAKFLLELGGPRVWLDIMTDRFKHMVSYCSVWIKILFWCDVWRDAVLYDEELITYFARW